MEELEMSNAQEMSKKELKQVDGGILGLFAAGVGLGLLYAIDFIIDGKIGM